MTKLRTLVLVGSIAGSALPLGAQALPTVKMDINSERFDQALPFDRTFVIEIPLAPKLTWMSVRVGPVKEGPMLINGNSVTGFMPDPVIATLTWTGVPFDVKTVLVRVPALQPHRQIMVEVMYSAGADSVELDARGNYVLDATGKVKTVSRIVRGRLVALGSTGGAFKDYFRTDVGVIAANRVGYVGGASNVHIHFSPVNDDAETDNLRGGYLWAKRVSLFAGVTLFKFHSDKAFDQMFSAGSPEFGVSVRPLIPHTPMLLNWIYLNGGLVYFNQKDPNPVIDKVHGKHAPFVGLGGAVTWQSVLGPLAAFLGAK